MKPKFKIGPAKTRDGREARIYALDGNHDTTIHGAVKIDRAWVLFTWCPDGSVSAFDTSGLDLMPNSWPETLEFECNWLRCSHGAVVPTFGPSLKDLIGKRTKVRIEVLDET